MKKTKIYITHAYGYEAAKNYWILNGKWSIAASLAFIKRHYTLGLLAMRDARISYIDEDGVEVAVFEPLKNEIEKAHADDAAKKFAALDNEAKKIDAGDYSGIESAKSNRGRVYRGVMRLPNGLPSLHRVYASELRAAGIEPSIANAVCAIKDGVVRGVSQMLASRGVNP